VPLEGVAASIMIAGDGGVSGVGCGGVGRWWWRRWWWGGLATCTHAALRTGTSVWVTPKVGSRVFRATRRLARQSLRAGAQGQLSCGWMQIESPCALGPASCVNNDALELMSGCVCAVRTSREEYARQRCLRNVGMTATRPIGRRAMMNRFGVLVWPGRACTNGGAVLRNMLRAPVGASVRGPRRVWDGGGLCVGEFSALAARQ